MEYTCELGVAPGQSVVIPPPHREGMLTPDSVARGIMEKTSATSRIAGYTPRTVAQGVSDGGSIRHSCMNGGPYLFHFVEPSVVFREHLAFLLAIPGC